MKWRAERVAIKWQQRGFNTLNITSGSPTHTSSVFCLVVMRLSCLPPSLFFLSTHIFTIFLIFYSPPLLVSLQTYFTGSRLGQVVTVLRGGQRAKRGRRGVCVSVFSVHFQSEQLTRLPASWCVVRSAEGLTLLFQFFLKLNLHQIIKPLMKIYPEHINKENSVPSCHHFLQDAMG